MNTNFHHPYEEQKDKLEKGDRLLLYTDGVLEESIKNSWNAETLLFSFTNSSNIGFDSALDYVIQDWKNKLGTNKIQDDATILMIEYHGI
jgi:serine phosphatase RsbU (regulator of sigma subunit)